MNTINGSYAASINDHEFRLRDIENYLTLLYERGDLEAEEFLEPIVKTTFERFDRENKSEEI